MLDPNPAPDASAARTPLLSAVHITKRFGTFAANDSIDLDLYPAETHALLGENGAGKSTLVKIIYGLLRPTSGELRWMGNKVDLAGPAQARALGIGMVFQHFSLFDNLTVAENVALGLSTNEPFNAMSKRLAELSRDYGLPLDPNREVWQLSVGERQRIEIVRALMQNPKLLILDEPTSVLTPQETDQLFITLARLKSEGRSLLYISHKLEEVKALCDTATILRGGKKVATCDPRRETAASLARMMVGADIGEVKAAAGRATGVPRLVVRDLTLEPDDPHGVRLQKVSLEVRAGEIVGIAGVSGNGQDELFSALSGERKSAEAGNVVIDGNGAGMLTITERRRLGAAFVPEERLGHGTAHEAFRQCAAHRACGERHGQSRFRQSRRDARYGRSHHQDVRRAQGEARPGGREPLRRQSAEIRGRPRNPARAGRAHRRAADLGCRCRRRGGDPPGADRSRRARRRGAGDLPGPR
jgi:ABC-type uncharacterized transport system ATPase subunit